MIHAMARATKAERKKLHAAAERKWLLKQLRLVLLIGAVAGLIAGVLPFFDSLFLVPPEQLVTVHHSHHCRCVAAWAEAIENAGFTVRMQDHHSLGSVRHSLRTPPTLRGCHVAEYMGYFVEGHVPPSALRKLLTERPTASGIALQSAAVFGARHPEAIVVDESNPVLLFDDRGRSQVWSRPATAPAGHP